MNPLYETMRLRHDHVRDGFRCGEAALDNYLKMQAGQDMKRGYATVVVATTPGSNEVIGYYTLCAYSVDLTALPDARRKKLPRYGRVPSVLLGRLAVHETAKGRKIGEFLLLDAIARACENELSWAFFIVRAKHDAAADFYRRYGFLSFADSPLDFFIDRKAAFGLIGPLLES
ncbi:MAG: GNAT family N-acetyltransferase [Planctomycetota bacterium]|jgi:ribosomal protein S18 acetylase RimI-like enzyme|nr:GNAT family N-acetyltransferase [Planctomycetota bacterium]